MSVNSLPKTVTRQRRDCDLNPGPTAPESSTLTTRLPSHPRRAVTELNWTPVRNTRMGPGVHSVRKVPKSWRTCVQKRVLHWGPVCHSRSRNFYSRCRLAPWAVTSAPVQVPQLSVLQNSPYKSVQFTWCAVNTPSEIHELETGIQFSSAAVNSALNLQVGNVVERESRGICGNPAVRLYCKC